MALGFFALSALALLPPTEPTSARSALEENISDQENSRLRDWVYAQQSDTGGFRGSPSSGDHDGQYAFPTVATSYTALLILAILDDPFTRLKRTALLTFVRKCQLPDGSFGPYPPTTNWREEGDMRHTFASFAICHILNDWSTVELDLSVNFILSCQTYEGAFAQQPSGESHGGTTSCALSSLSLSNRLSSLVRKEDTIRWLNSLQTAFTPEPPSPTSSPEPDTADSYQIKEDQDWVLSKVTPPLAPPQTSVTDWGFAGRVNKEPDACYSFWISVGLDILCPELGIPSPEKHENYLLSCQHPIYGGIAKSPGEKPDIYHTYLSLASLSIQTPSKFNLNKLNPILNVPISVVFPPLVRM